MIGTIQISVTTEDGAVLSFAVDPKEIVENIKALVSVETGIDLPQQALLYNGTEMQDQRTLESYGVKEHDLIFVTTKDRLAPARPQQLQQQLQQGPGGKINPREFIEYVRSNPELLGQLLQSNPPLASAVLEENIEVIDQILSQQTEARRRQLEEQQRRIARLNADPFDMETQKQIEEEIRMENVNANMESAIEHHPEAFSRVHMLYVDCLVNGVPVKAFVDSGAQSTIMNTACAERCGLMRLVDRRFAGTAVGVGTAKIVGRVHVAPIKLGNSFFPSSFSILEDQSMDFLLGLDYLRRHQCCIDLKDNVLRIGDESVPFLAEKDIPTSLRESAEKLDVSVNPPPASTTTSTSTSTHTAPPVRTSPAPQPAAPKQTPVAIPSPAAPKQTAPPAGAPEEAIQQLMAIANVPRERAIQALRNAGGNLELAASQLLGFF
eukprot:TRINITY_DN1224_c0_g1_i1.p1 TRINITY_DN1224_c0_g1~~TRINITY_DN1224_c0_g1_i1.p1  ORF type:complete len:474 (+),score=149.37 TRINITY_DN1224_c0_g1_i1:117-1424(+)